MPEPPIMPSTALVMRLPKAKGPQRGPLYCKPAAASNRGLLRVLAVHELARLFHLVPDLFLREVQKTRQHDQEEDYLGADALARHHMRLGGPHQKGRNVLGILIERLRRAVVVFNLPVLQRRRHGDAMAGEILVVV